MKGDFSRITYDPRNHFSRVLLQQGRVSLDADPNEQASILLHYIQTLARDLIGPYGGPQDALGFALTPVAAKPAQGAQPAVPASLSIGHGRYYVQGMLCENETPCDYAKQPDYTPPADDALLKELKTPTGQGFWLYLDVWERYISFIENDHIREVALGGPDTCGRSRIVWQVKALPVQLNANATAAKASSGATAAANTSANAGAATAAAQAAQPTDQAALEYGSPCVAPLRGLNGISKAKMSARLDPGMQVKDPCITAPGARYRGPENCLYRVEIHDGGAVGQASFKWSRDNGSVATRWLGNGDGGGLTVASSRGFAAGNWVEITDDTAELRGLPGTMVKLSAVSGDLLSLDSASAAAAGTAATTWSAQLVNPKVRRWDEVQNDATTLNYDGSVPLREASATDPAWIDLEDGVQVQFAAGGSYNSGDYWLIPARVATGDIDWPVTVDSSNNPMPQALAPSGVHHYYAPLGIISWDSGNQVFGLDNECRCKLLPTNSCSRATFNVATEQPRPANPIAVETPTPVTAVVVDTPKPVATVAGKPKPTAVTVDKPRPVLAPAADTAQPAATPKPKK
jgi:hypothetical protein